MIELIGMVRFWWLGASLLGLLDVFPGTVTAPRRHPFNKV